MPERTTPFTWIVKGKMAASWWPDSSIFYRYRNEGVKVIINASEFDNRKEVSNKFSYYHINIPDFGVPTEKQIEKFLEITKKHTAN